ncbi:MAG: hypothetical protein NT077_04365 [Candidatus Taylorbacteria bacterium]|nr:hypothetical protein [Candidatus Taylorbacteria bacterium]
MKKYIVLILVIIALIVGFIVYKSDLRNNSSIYQNTKFGYRLTLPSGWYLLNEADDKDNVVITNNLTPDTSSGSPVGPDRIAIGLTPTDSSNVQEVATNEKTVRKISTQNGYQGFIRIDNSANSKGTVVYLQFISDQNLTTNGNGQKPKGITFILSGKIDEDLLMKIANSFKKV